MRVILKDKEKIEIYNYTKDEALYSRISHRNEKFYFLNFQEFIETLTPSVYIEKNDINGEEFEEIYTFLLDNYDYNAVFVNNEDVKVDK